MNNYSQAGTYQDLHIFPYQSVEGVIFKALEVE